MDASIPPKTPVPIDSRAAAPAPCAVINGTTPKIKAKEVIIIGLNQSLAASRAASLTDIPSSTFWIANSKTKIAFLADKPTKTKSPI